MAVTKLMNIKESAGGGGKHLYNSIRYILNPDKTQGGLLTGGNAGYGHEEAYRAMMDTKKAWGKPEGRQGYHFILSWKPGEINEQDAYTMLKEFCDEYLGDSYDYVFAVHNDKAHMHGHIIFNSVNRETGYKYRYEKGDWEKHIQPVTDRICARHGFKKLEYDRENKIGVPYAEFLAKKEGRLHWKGIIQGDIDYAVSSARSFEEFQGKMAAMGYKLKTGFSYKRGKEYMSFKAPGQKRPWRDTSLGQGYALQEIRSRIQQETFKYDIPRPPKLKFCKAGAALGGQAFMSRYQVRKVRSLYQTSSYFTRRNPYAVDPGQIRRNLLQIGRLREDCRYLMRRGIKTPQELKEREDELRKEERSCLLRRDKWNSLKEDRRYLEYKELKEQLGEVPAWDDSFEGILDRLEDMEAGLPLDMHEFERESHALEEKLQAIRQEKRVIRHIQRTDKEAEGTKLRAARGVYQEAGRKKEGGKAWQKKQANPRK